MSSIRASAAHSMAAIAALAGGGIWLLTHEYVGLNGDGALYAMMAVNRTVPGVFGTDLFLRYGSQDAYSIFSPIYGWMIGAVGFFRANIALLVVSHLLWLTGAWLLCHRLSRGRAGHLAFLAVCAMPLTYGGASFLAAGEPFLTSRPFAEAFVLIALARLLSRAWITAAVALAVAAAFHPLVALAGLGAAFVALAIRRPVWLWAAPAGGLLLLGAALVHVEPFSRALVTMDDVWFSAVRRYNSFVLVTTWTGVDWARAVCAVTPCAVAALWTRGLRRGVFAGAAVVCAVALSVTLVGGDVARDALIVQLQLWRTGWLTAVIQVPALVVIWLRLRRRPMGRPITALVAAPSLMLTLAVEDAVWAPALVMSLLGLLMAVLAKTRRLPPLGRRWERRCLVAVAILPIANIVVQAALMGWLAVFDMRLGLMLTNEPNFLPVRLALLAGAWALIRRSSRQFAAALGVVAVVFIAGVLTWDERSPWERFVLAGRSPPLTATLPAGAALLWGSDPADAWFLFHRPAYVSVVQSSGLLFSRVTALEWLKRRGDVAEITSIGAWTPTPRMRPCASFTAPVPRAVVNATCARSPGLYAVILRRPVAGAPSFTTPAPKETVCSKGTDFGVVRVSRFYYVRCGGR